MKREPKINEQIYVPTSLHVYRGFDDYIGGLATITDIEYKKHLPKDHYNYCFVEINNIKGSTYNWNYLLEQQESLKEQFGNQVAYPDPDLRPEFNDDEEGWR
jgi:hypothetical protein